MRRISGGVILAAERGAVSIDAKSRGSACDVAAMASAIKWVGIGYGYIATVIIIADQVNATLNFRRVVAEQAGIGRCRTGRKCSVIGGGSARASEICMRIVYAGVDDGDLDRLTTVGGLTAPNTGRTDEGNAYGVAGFVNANWLDADNTGNRPQRIHQVLGDLHLDAVQGVLVTRENLGTAGLELRLHTRLLRLALGDDRVFLDTRQQAKRILLRNCNRITGEQNDYRYRPGIGPARHEGC